MEIDVKDFLDEVDREYAGLTLNTEDDGKIVLRSALRLGNDTLQRIDRTQLELSRMQESATDLDYDKATGLLVDTLAMAADRPDALRTLVKSWDIGTLRALVAKWQKETQGEALAQ